MNTFISADVFDFLQYQQTKTTINTTQSIPTPIPIPAFSVPVKEKKLR